MSMNLRVLLIPVFLMSLVSPANAEESYGDTVGRKLGSGFSNIALGWLEIPKNVLNTSNDLNLIAGFSLGVLKGVLHTTGRMLTGVVDVVSAPLPTQPIVEPDYVWENFAIDTHYGPAFQQKE